MSERAVARLLTWLLAGAVLLATLVPVAYMIVTSLAADPAYLAPETPLRLTLAHYRAVLGASDLHFLDYLENSIVVSATSALLAVALAALAAYALSRMALPGRTAVLLGVLAFSMFPQVSLLSYLFKLMTWLGWINTYPALIGPYVAWVLPLSLWILVAYFSQIPPDLDRAARVDGCSRLQVLFRVILPVATPGLVSTLLLAFVFAFNEFMFALMLTTDYRARTAPVGIALFEGLHGELPWGQVMAAATVATLPVMILTLLFQRRIVEGLTRGAVKG